MAYNQTVRVFGPVTQKPLRETIRVREKFFGLNYPIGKNKSSGGFFQKTSGYETIKASITQLLLTERGERVMLPNFGCSLKRYLFRPLDSMLFVQIKDEIVDSITSYTKDVKILKVAVFELDKINLDGSHGLRVILTLALSQEAQNQFEIEVVVQ
jgi:phage baseplate assembly protein W